MSRYAYQGNFTDGNGRAVDAGTVTCYLAGTSTGATIYTVSSGGSADSDSAVATNSAGYFIFYVDDVNYGPAQLFDVTLSKTAFVTVTIVNVRLIPNAAGLSVVATADLPAAAAAQNGRVVIEDNGVGDRNLVFYSGGQRFRIDGGANV